MESYLGPAIIGAGVLVLVFGIIKYFKDREDPETRKKSLERIARVRGNKR